MKLRSSGRIVACLFFVTLFLVGFATFVSAQETTGQLSGVLKDPSGAAIPDATVTVTNKATGRVTTTTTGPVGDFTVRSLEPGRYSVRFTKSGFAPLELSDASVILGRTQRADGTMKVGQLQTAVTVIETAPLIDTSSTAVSHNITAEEFDRLPKARSFQGLLTASPSVNSGQDQFGNLVGVEGGLQVNGASAAENQFFIDGVSTNSQIQGQSRQNAAFEFLQEVQVKTGGTPAEFGGALGGVMSAVTKSGGNQFHGEAHYYFAGDKLTAMPIRRLLNPLTVTVNGFNTIGSGGYVQDLKTSDKRNEVGGSFGGPILKEKAWFFASISPQFRRRELPYTFTDGTDAVKVKRIDRQAFAKVSYNPAQRVRTNFTYLWTPTNSTGSPLAYNGAANSRATTVAANQINKQSGFFQVQSNYTGNIDVTLNSRMLVSVRGGRFWDNYKSSGVPKITAVEYQNSTSTLTPALLATVPANLQGGLGFTNTPRLQLTDHDVAARSFVNADYSVTGNLGGAHDAKLGWGTMKNVNNVDFSYPNGGYVFVFWGQSFTSSVTGAPCNLAPCTGKYGYYEVDDVGTKGSTGGTINSFYGQDRWRILPRLTLDMGLRFENESVPSFRRSVLDPAFKFGFRDKVMPRLGMAIDVRGDGKMKASFSWGRFYDWVKYELSRGTFGGDIWTTKYRALDSAADVFSLSAQNMPGKDLWDERSTGSFQDHRIPAFNASCSTTNLSSCQVDPSLKPTGTDLINATLEYQINTRTVFRASYVRNSMIRAIEDMGVLVNGSEEYLYVNPGQGLLGKVMNITPGTTTKAPESLCRHSNRLSATDLVNCLAGKVFPTPKASRNYNALELSVTRRFASGWFFDASYVLSRLSGNYPGISNSDEIRSASTGSSFPIGQQQSGNLARGGSSAGRAWDLDQIVFDSKGNIGTFGKLPTDRPQVLKAYGSYNFKFGTEVGVFFNASSGTPMTTYAFSTDRIAMRVNGRGDMGRTPALKQTDMLVAHSFNLSEGKKLRFEFNMTNLFNQKTARHIFNCVNYDCINGQVASGMKLAGVNLFQGFDYKALIAASSNGQAAFDPRYGKPELFNPGFAGRFGVKYTF